MFLRLVSLLLCGLVLASPAGAQGPAAPTPPTGVAGGNVGLVVADMDRAMAFYRDVLGLPVSTGGAAPWEDPALRAAAVTTVPIPGGQWALELVKLARPTAAFRPRMQDPGALTLILFVQDLDGIRARARAAGFPIVTVGGIVGVGNNGAIKASVVQGPDGEFIELLQPPPPAPVASPAAGPVAAPPAGATNVLRGNVRVSVADANAAAKAYEALLGIQFRGGPAPVADPGVPAMLGHPGATFHLRIGQFPVSAMTFELLEIAGPAKSNVRALRSAPGAVYLRVGLAPQRTPAAGAQTDRDNVFLIVNPLQP